MVQSINYSVLPFSFSRPQAASICHQLTAKGVWNRIVNSQDGTTSIKVGTTDGMYTRISAWIESLQNREA